MQAKAIAQKELRALAALSIILPRVEAETLETIALMGGDFWKHGVAESGRDIEALARYSYEQGLAQRTLTPEELFAPSTFEVSRI